MTKIAILTNFNDLNRGYSLTSVVLDQICMLKKYNHDVTLYVSDNFANVDNYDFKIKPVMTINNLVDYQNYGDITSEHINQIDAFSQYLIEELKTYDYVFTHDFIFTGWNLPYAVSILKASPKLPCIKNWLHWVHSIPSGQKDWWDFNLYGKNHKIVYPNKLDKVIVAEQFRTLPHAVLTIPHIKDIRTWFGFNNDTNKIIDMFPAIMQADIVQIYPASSDRLNSKGIEDIIHIFSSFKKMGKSVCILIANQWATGRKSKEDIKKYEYFAREKGLIVGKEFAFISTINEQYKNGLPQNILRELLQCSNLFVFPTRGESFGFVSLEASLSSGALLVLNLSLLMLHEIHGGTGIYHSFDSYLKSLSILDKESYFYDIAILILDKLKSEEGILSRTYIKKTYNYDTIYHRYYESLLKS